MDVVYSLKAIHHYLMSNEIDKHEKIMGIIKRFPLDLMDEEKSNKLLLKILYIIMNEDDKVAFEKVLDHWEETVPQGELSILATFFKNPSNSDEFLSYAVSCMNKISATNLLIEFIEHDTNRNYIIPMERILNIYGPMEFEEYMTIYKFAVDEVNNYVLGMGFLSEKLMEVAPYADKPEWVTGEITQKFEDMVIPNFIKIEDLPEPKEAVELLTNGFYNIGLTFEDRERDKLKLLDILKNVSPEEYEEMLTPVLTAHQRSKLQSNLELFRILGPCNPMLNDDLVEDSEQNEQGGPRMFTDNTFEGYDELNEEVTNDDWFDGDGSKSYGSCEVCYKKIAKRHYALRMPLLTGGFVGCFCYFKCLKGSQDRGIENNPLIMKLIEKMELSIYANGIQDRL